MVFNRQFVSKLLSRLVHEDTPLIQVVIGPRQVGKTTGVKSVLSQVTQSHYATTDLARAPDHEWIVAQWQAAKAKGHGTILAIDEIQRIDRWSDIIKALFDEDRMSGAVKVIILGSSSLSLRHGLGDSLLGRFELIEVPHWSYWESHHALGWDLNKHLMFGGYPGAAHLIQDVDRWQAFIRDSIIESVLAKDIFMLAKIGKPALFRQLMEIVLQYPAQEISYQKLVGQLSDSGSIETVKGYLDIMNSAYLLRSIEKFSTRALSTKASSPKLLPSCPALAHSIQSPFEVVNNPSWRGRIVEAVVGAHLAKIPNTRLFYWRDGVDEVDFVLKGHNQILGIEVKSGLKTPSKAQSETLSKNTSKGVASFRARFRDARCVTLMEPMLETLLNQDEPTKCWEWLRELGV